MLVYVDDILHLEYFLKEDMDGLNCTYIYWEESFGTAKRRCLDNFEKFHVQNEKDCFPMNCVDYLQGAINNVDDILSKDHRECIKYYGKGEK